MCLCTYIHGDTLLNVRQTYFYVIWSQRQGIRSRSRKRDALDALNTIVLPTIRWFSFMYMCVRTVRTFVFSLFIIGLYSKLNLCFFFLFIWCVRNWNEHIKCIRMHFDIYIFSGDRFVTPNTRRLCCFFIRLLNAIICTCVLKKWV